MQGCQLPAAEGCLRCLGCALHRTSTPQIWLQLRVEPSPPWSPPTSKKSLTTKSPYRSQRFSTIPIQTSSRFSRCRRPSLSSKRPLRACQLTPARLQSSSLNEIPNPARPSTKFLADFHRLEPLSASRHEAYARTDKRESALELRSTGSIVCPRLLHPEAT
ncbi:uncharacterized protein P884DRAFT_281422 [Thermothelomyces heterothallicus CBS 202.75]|uniref:uncharacterized protein n=1 Tax=Thermothelomyces heterothallicus CBS 202.75 TaxID=1149848 RepID=UPI003742E316